MKIITVYELVGLVKDGKAPKQVKWEDYIFEYNKEQNDYISIEYVRIGEKGLLFSISRDLLFERLNDTVEILPEENDEWEDIEELNNNFTFEDTICELTDNDYKISCLSKKINKLIKNQKYLKERLDKDDR